MNTTNPQQHTKFDEILKKIESNELSPKSKLYFRLRLAALIFLLTAIALVTIFFSSFILFSLRESGHANLIGFGPSGFSVFMHLFPWKLLVVEIILVILLEYLLRTFRFGYKIPALYLLIGVFALMIVSGIVVGQTPLHHELLRRADQQRLPGIFENMYENTRRPPPRDSGIFRGTVTAIDSNGLIVDLENPEHVPVADVPTSVHVVLPQAQFNGTVNVGDKIFIRGTMDHQVIDAFEIRSGTDRLPRPEPRPGRFEGR